MALFNEPDRVRREHETENKWRSHPSKNCTTAKERSVCEGTSKTRLEGERVDLMPAYCVITSKSDY